MLIKKTGGIIDKKLLKQWKKWIGKAKKLFSMKY